MKMKQLLGLLLTLMMTLTLLSTFSVVANTETYGLIFDKATGAFYLDTEGDGTVKTENKYNGQSDKWEWSNTSSTLTFTDFTWATDALMALTIIGNITLEVKGTNTLKSNKAEDMMTSNGIFVNGNLTITGSGALNTSGGNCDDNENYAESYGLNVQGTLTITGATINAEGGAVQNGATFGIYAMNDMTIADGEISATGGECGLEDSTSYGIRTDGCLTIDDGNVNATGGTAGNNAYGVNANALDVKDGTINAVGGNAGRESNGITLNLNSKVSGGTVITTGGNAGDDSYGLFCFNPFTFEGGTITAIGNKSAFYSSPAIIPASYAHKTGINITEPGDGAWDEYYNSTGTEYSFAATDKFTKLTTIPFALIGDVTVSGVQHTALEPQTTTLTLYLDRISVAQAGSINWFANAPSGVDITANAVTSSNTVALTFGGTPTTVSSATFEITIPGAILTNGNNIPVAENTNAKFSIAARVNAATPNISGQPTGVTYTQNAAATELTVTANSTDIGDLTYQWYSNTTDSNSTGTLISGATNSGYTPSTTATGTVYYYCIVTNTNNSVNGTKTATATSNAAAIVVNNLINAVAPSISEHPVGATYTQNETAAALTVTANSTDGGNLSYQWYSNTANDNSTGTLIDGATSTTYKPSTAAIGTTYYYCIVTNTITDNGDGGMKTATALSNTAAITVNAVSGYTITFDANGGSVTPTTAPTGADGKLSDLLTPTRSGSYRFDGWFTARSGGTQITVDTIFDDNDTIYAQWTYTGGGGGGGGTTYYTVTFDTSGGSKVYSQRIARNSKVTKPADPAKDDFTFAGWYDDKDLNTEYDFSKSVTANITIYAKWTDAGTPTPDPNGAGTGGSGDDRHEAYMLGYPDGSFGPDNNMTRAETAMMLYRLLSNGEATQTATFSDIPDGQWYTEAVRTLAGMGILKGYPDGTFKPEASITRAEFTAMVTRFVDDASASMSFPDVTTAHWAYEAIGTATGYGWIVGYPDGTFRPDDFITRAEAVKVMNAVLERKPDKAYIDGHIGSLTTFPDVEKEFWAYYEIIEAANTHNYTVTDNEEYWKL